MIFKRNSDTALEKRIERLEDHAEKLIKLVNTTIEELDDLKDKHLRLRGKVYAHKLHKADDAEEPKPSSRDELRRSLALSGRFVPGKPANHT